MPLQTAHVLLKEKCSELNFFQEVIINKMYHYVEAKEYFAVFQTSHKQFGMGLLQALLVNTIGV